jgi:hypothetical protein
VVSVGAGGAVRGRRGLSYRAGTFGPPGGSCSRAALVETIQREVTAMAESKRDLWAEHPRWEGQPRCRQCRQPLIAPSSQKIGVCLRCRPADERPLEADYDGDRER